MAKYYEWNEREQLFNILKKEGFETSKLAKKWEEWEAEDQGSNGWGAGSIGVGIKINSISQDVASLDCNSSNAWNWTSNLSKEGEIK